MIHLQIIKHVSFTHLHCTQRMLPMSCWLWPVQLWDSSLHFQHWRSLQHSENNTLYTFSLLLWMKISTWKLQISASIFFFFFLNLEIGNTVSNANINNELTFYTNTNLYNFSWSVYWSFCTKEITKIARVNNITKELKQQKHKIPLIQIWDTRY